MHDWLLDLLLHRMGGIRNKLKIKRHQLFRLSTSTWIWSYNTNDAQTHKMIWESESIETRIVHRTHAIIIWITSIFKWYGYGYWYAGYVTTHDTHIF